MFTSIAGIAGNSTRRHRRWGQRERSIPEIRRQTGRSQILLETLEDRFAPASTLTQSLYPVLATAQQGAQFGYAVASDANLRVVGTPYADVAGVADTGTVSVYNTTTGALVTTLYDPEPGAHDQFGCSVGLSGNLVVVGANGDDAGASNSGQAYVFNATTGALLWTLANPSPAKSDTFGTSVAISENSIVVGAPFDDTGGTDSGQVYVFDASTGTLLRTIADPTPSAGDQFGYSVAISGNVLVAGANCDGAGANKSGQAYVFDASNGALLWTLANPTPAAADQFGNAVAISGSTIVVAAALDDTGATDSGQAYLFDANTGALRLTLANPTPYSNDQFGFSVAASGNNVVVGVPYDHAAAVDSGQAYVFDVTTGALTMTIANPSPARNDAFGNAVTISGNMIVVGDAFDDTQDTDQGAAFVFVIAPPTVTAVSPFIGPTSGGNTVVISGSNFNGIDPNHLPAAVQFGGVNATSYTVNSDSQITAVAPAGSSTVDVVVANAAGVSTITGSDSYLYAVPAVTGVIVNGGAIVARNLYGGAPSLAGQQSVVEQILVTFNMPVRLDANAFTISSLASAVTACAAAPSTADIAVTATGVPGAGDDTQGYAQYILTFNAGDGVHSYDNSSGLGNAFTTLKDGFYQLNTLGSNIHAGVSNTAADRTDKFWALYGTVDPADITVSKILGDGNSKLLVDGIALGEMYQTFGSFANVPGAPPYMTPYDCDLDGIIDGVELGRLYTNFGTQWLL